MTEIERLTSILGDRIGTGLGSLLDVDLSELPEAIREASINIKERLVAVAAAIEKGKSSDD